VVALGEVWTEQFAKAPFDLPTINGHVIPVDTDKGGFTGNKLGTTLALQAQPAYNAKATACGRISWRDRQLQRKPDVTRMCHQYL
jgi:hypothetical protein